MLQSSLKVVSGLLGIVLGIFGILFLCFTIYLTIGGIYQFYGTYYTIKKSNCTSMVIEGKTQLVCPYQE